MMQVLNLGIELPLVVRVPDVSAEHLSHRPLHGEQKSIDQTLEASSLGVGRTITLRASLTAWSTANLPTILAEGACF
jgi:hypothetical protein